MMKNYRRDRNEDNNPQLIEFETPVLIKHLCFCEQNAAHGALLARCPGEKLQAYFDLHLVRLKAASGDIHDASIAVKTAKYIKIKCAEDIKKQKADGAERREESRVLKTRAEEAVREMETLRVHKRAVLRLVVWCWDLMEQRLLIRRTIEAKYGYGTWNIAKQMPTGREC